MCRPARSPHSNPSSKDVLAKRLAPWTSAEVDGKFEERQVRAVLNQKKTWWFTSWFGVYQPELTEADQANIRDFYLNHGYLDVKVGDYA